MTAATGPRSTGHGSHNLEGVCCAERRVVAASLRAVGGGLCREVSLGTWEPGPCLYQLFPIGNDLFCIAKIDTEMGEAPTSQARPRDTDYLRPLNLAASTLISVGHTPSKFGHDPSPVRQGIVAAVKCCAKNAFFCCLGRFWNRKKEVKALCGFQHHKGDVLFGFLLFDHVGRTHTIVRLQTRICRKDGMEDFGGFVYVLDGFLQRDFVL